MSVLLETTLGDLVVDLFVDERPRSCMNFLKLCKVKYYNFCLFFSIQRNFIAQTGDPSGFGKGGESIYRTLYGDQARYFEMEVKPRIKHRRKGLVSFANNGNNMHGSQFFITLGEDLDYLDGKHTVFGEIAEGFDTLEKINETICDEDDRPYQDIRINHTIIIDDPFDDPAGLKIPDRSPEPTKEQLDSGRIGADEEIDDTKGKSAEEVQRMIEEKDLQIGTQILETIGDIPDADLKPPENVLFVCKLNPVTTAEDLQIIFSRFGPIQRIASVMSYLSENETENPQNGDVHLSQIPDWDKISREPFGTLSCEIILDHKTGDSLCYGFIEYEKVEDCEKAYFKMDNVLIDDRRIHVDFCQSVAKVKWKKSGIFQRQAKQKIQVSQKLSMKGKDRQDKYKMVFSDDGQSSDENNRKSNGRRADKKNKKKKKKYDKEDSESEDEHRHRHKKKKNKERGRRGSESRSVSPVNKRKSHNIEKEHRIKKRSRSSGSSEDGPTPEKRKDIRHRDRERDRVREHRRDRDVDHKRKNTFSEERTRQGDSDRSSEKKYKKSVKELEDEHEGRDKGRKRHKEKTKHRSRSRSESIEYKNKRKYDSDSG